MYKKAPVAIVFLSTAIFSPHQAAAYTIPADPTYNACGDGVAEHIEERSRTAAKFEAEERAGAIIDPESVVDLSCLDDLLATGFNVFFNVPSLDDILNQIQRRVCAAASNAFNEATSGLSQRFSTKLPSIRTPVGDIDLGTVSTGTNSNSSGTYNLDGTLPDGTEIDMDAGDLNLPNAGEPSITEPAYVYPPNIF